MTGSWPWPDLTSSRPSRVWELQDISTGQPHRSLRVSMPGCIRTAVSTNTVAPTCAASAHGITHTHPTPKRSSGIMLDSSFPHSSLNTKKSSSLRDPTPKQLLHLTILPVYMATAASDPPPVVPRIPALSLELVPLPPGLISPSICATAKSSLYKTKIR